MHRFSEITAHGSVCRVRRLHRLLLPDDTDAAGVDGISITTTRFPAAVSPKFRATLRLRRRGGSITGVQGSVIAPCTLADRRAHRRRNAEPDFSRRSRRFLTFVPETPIDSSFPIAPAILTLAKQIAGGRS